MWYRQAGNAGGNDTAAQQLRAVCFRVHEEEDAEPVTRLLPSSSMGQQAR